MITYNIPDKIAPESIRNSILKTANLQHTSRYCVSFIKKLQKYSGTTIQIIHFAKMFYFNNLSGDHVVILRSNGAQDGHNNRPVSRPSI